MFSPSLGRTIVRTLQSMASSNKKKVVEQRIETKLQQAFRPQFLQIINESHKHSV